jgi:DNA-directed RNA polymerase subunit RPC12/RpoP
LRGIFEGDVSMAFNDAHCSRCGKKISWVGSLLDRPPCPGCGHQIPLEELKRDEEEKIRAFEELLLEKKERKKIFE